MTIRPFLVNGAWRTGEGTFEVKSPFDDSVVAEVGVPTAADVEEAMATAEATFEESKKLPVWARSEALDHISKRLAETVEENAELIAREGGKPIKWAKVEATRAISTFRWASEVIRHGDDELMRLDTEQSLGSRVGVLRRFPLGPVLGITPFNFPLNLVAHKVAPALGVGAPITVKPASATPIGSLRLAEFFHETDLPKGMYQVLPVSSKVADGMARAERFRKNSFTGSSEIGWYLKGLDPKEAVSQGAEILTGGTGEGPFFQPALLSDVTPEMKVCREEIFGPVVTISPYETFEDALKLVNDSRFGLQAGVFTNDIDRAFEAHRTIEVGGVIINDVSAFRADQMPYGGSKDSGFGREGLRFAMEEMTEPRIMVLSHVPL